MPAEPDFAKVTMGSAVTFSVQHVMIKEIEATNIATRMNRKKFAAGPSSSLIGALLRILACIEGFIENAVLCLELLSSRLSFRPRIFLLSF